LQSAFIQELIRVKGRYVINETGAVVFMQSDADTVINAAHAVRDSLFPWYFMKWNNHRETYRFAALLKEASLPFYLEEHESGTWFLVRSEDKLSHERISQHVQDKGQEIKEQEGTK
jgi:hypothetical protein